MKLQIALPEFLLAASFLPYCWGDILWYNNRAIWLNAIGSDSVALKEDFNSLPSGLTPQPFKQVILTDPVQIGDLVFSTTGAQPQIRMVSGSYDGPNLVNHPVDDTDFLSVGIRH